MAEKNGNGKRVALESSKYSDHYVVRDREYGYGAPFPFKVTAHARFLIDARGHFALECVAKWGMVAALDDGEDSSGRAKLALQKPEDVVARAFDIAERSYDELEKRGWVSRVPSADECVEMLKDSENEND